MIEIKHIVFDVGQVLIKWDREIPFRHLIPDQQKRDWFLDTVCTPEWNLEQDRGRSWEDAEELLIKQHPDDETAIRGFRKHWVEMIHDAVEGTATIMQGLMDAGHDVTLLTNFHRDTFQLAKQKYPFLEKPRGETVSGEVGLIKPEKAIYDHHVSSHSLEPEATLFFDDSKSNVAGARDAGWHAELFVDALLLERDLDRYGVRYV